MKILFVCLGNICRSPLAEAAAKDIAKQRGLDFTINSAGTSSFHIGEPPCDYSIKVAKEHGLDISSYKATQVTKNDINRYDLVIALDSSNKKELQKLGFSNVKLLGEYGYNGADVPDPYYFETYDEGIKEVFNIIRKCVENMFNKL